jgi:hypothetical protein
MPTTHDERPFERHGKVFSALLNEQDDGRLSVTVRLPDGSLRTVPGEHFDSASAALAAAEAFAEELVGEC